MAGLWLSHHIGNGIIIPTDELTPSFFRGVGWNHQPEDIVVLLACPGGVLGRPQTIMANHAYVATKSCMTCLLLSKQPTGLERHAIDLATMGSKMPWNRYSGNTLHDNLKMQHFFFWIKRQMAWLTTTTATTILTITITIIITTGWGPQDSVQLPYFSGFMVDITIVNRGYFMVYKPTNITGGAPSCITILIHWSVGCARPMICWRIRSAGSSTIDLGSRQCRFSTAVRCAVGWVMTMSHPLCKS